MVKTILCSTTDNQMIKDMSKVLKEIGFEEASENYYESDTYSTPFFKIPKKFKKESPEDPDVFNIYIDIGCDEYVVHGRYIHEHIQDKYQAALLARNLLDGVIVEVAIFYPNKMAGFFMPNLGAPEKNVGVIDANAKEIMEHLSSPSASSPYFHMHTLFQTAYPYFLQVGGGSQPQIEGAQIYMVSSVFAEHPEYYIIA